MRVLITTPFYPPDFGGISTHVGKLVNILSKKFDIKVITNSLEKTCSITSNVVRIPSITLPSFPFQTLTSFRIPLAPDVLIKTIKEFRPDIIHAHGHHYPLTWLSVLMAKSKRIPCILTLHGMYALTGRPTLLEDLFNQTILKWLTNVAKHTIVLTPTMLSFVKKYNTHANCLIIPNGIDLHIYRDNLNRKFEYRKKYSLDDDKIIVLYRGRFVEIKGFRELIYAIKALNMYENIRSRVLFLLVGGGPLKDLAVRELSQYTNCRIIPWVPVESIHELYIASDIFIIPSKWAEAFSIVTLEAIASSLYIISSKNGSLPDILDKYPRKIYLREVTVSEIVNKLTILINSWNTMNEQCHDGELTYLKNFDWTNIADKIEYLYKQSVN
ncbi:MAG: glycosyltransferase family 4 protein [Thermoproteota archaeon]|uniref:Glycosyltransferase family 1 protein n=1 Tax=Ignisphaera aggregans TaxID=334771 RepID=A0A7C4H4J7_9CREN